MTKLPRVRYGNLSAWARDRVLWSRAGQATTIAGYVRWAFPDGEWRGDACGCTDDRCAYGYHHDALTDCGCLDVLLDHYADHLAGRHGSYCPSTCVRV